MRDQGTFKLTNPWPLIAWTALVVLVVVSGVLGFAVLGVFQQNAPVSDLWGAICRSLGITADTGPSAEPAPPLRTPTRVAWTTDTLARIASGNVQHGAFVALNCIACHGEAGVSTSSLNPTLAGMDAAAIYKQLDDYRSGKRFWGVMGAIAQALSPQDSADVAAYFSSQAGGLPALHADRIPESGRSLRESDPVKRLVFAGDPERAIPPCSACHGPGGFKIGVPALVNQQSAYVQRQLSSFAQGIRDNDIYSQMRAITKQLTPDEIHGLASFYATLTE